MNHLFDLMRKTQEAHAVRLGIPVERKFSDVDLEESMQVLSHVEQELDGDERLGKLSPEEKSLLDELNGENMLPFRVTITTEDRIEPVNVIAPDACAATFRAYEIAFGEFGEENPKSLKVKVEPIRDSRLRRVV